MDELSSMEKEIYKFVRNSNDLIEQNKSLHKKVKQLEDENEVLKMKVEDIETKLNNAYIDSENSTFNSLFNEEDKEKLKAKISDLLTKIDFHLRS